MFLWSRRAPKKLKTTPRTPSEDFEAMSVQLHPNLSRALSLIHLSQLPQLAE